MRVHDELYNAIFYGGLGILAVLCFSHWFWTERNREADIVGIVLSGEVTGAYRENKAYARFQENYRLRIQTLDKIAEDQRRFKELHPDWPGQIPGGSKGVSATLAGSDAGGSVGVRGGGGGVGTGSL